MATMNAKNAPLSAAGQDLGIQDAINLTIQDKLDEEKKRQKLLGQSPAAIALGLTSAPGAGMTLR